MELAARLSRAGCVAAEDEARELVGACGWGPLPAVRPCRPTRRRRAAGVGHRSLRLRRPDGSRPPRGLRAPLAEPGAGPACRRPSPRRRGGDRPLHGHGCRGRRSAGGPARRHGSWRRTAIRAPSPAPAPTASRRFRVTSSKPCRRLFGGRPMSSWRWCPTSPPPRWTCSPATPSASRTPRTTTAARTAPTCCAGSSGPRPAFCAGEGRCCWSWAGTRPSCSVPPSSSLGYARVADLDRRGRRPAWPGGRVG